MYESSLFVRSTISFWVGSDFSGSLITVKNLLPSFFNLEEMEKVLFSIGLVY